MGNEKFKSFKALDLYMEENDSLFPKGNIISAKHSKKSRNLNDYAIYKDLSTSEKKKYLEKKGFSFSHLTVEYILEKNLAVIPRLNPFTGDELIVKVIPSKNHVNRVPRKDGKYRIKGYLKINPSAISSEEILFFWEGPANVSDSVSKKQKKQIQKIINRGIIAPRKDKDNTDNTKEHDKGYSTKLIGASWDDLAALKEQDKIYFNDFVTTTDLNSCTKNHHDIEQISAVIFVLRKDGTVMPKRIPASFCKTCRRYYMSRWQFEALCEDGKPLCQLVKQYSYKENHHSGYYDALNAESKLHISGYNVGSNEDLSEIQRHTLLTFLIESGICNKHEINAHLSWLINSRQGQANMINAIKKWENDRHFTDSYKIGTNRTVGVRLIRHKVHL